MKNHEEPDPPFFARPWFGFPWSPELRALELGVSGGWHGLRGRFGASEWHTQGRWTPKRNAMELILEAQLDDAFHWHR